MKHFARQIIVTLPLLVCAVSSSAPAANVKVFILSGQSNMVGCGKVSELGDLSTYTFPNVKIYVAIQGDNTLRVIPQLKPGNTSLTDQTPPDYYAMFGPEIGIAQQLTKKYPGDQLVLIKVAVGGSCLQTNWLNNGKMPSDPQTTLYPWFLNHVKNALADIKKTSTPVIMGFIWMQGESDGVSVDCASNYSGNLATFVGMIRRDIAAQMPFVYGLIQNAAQSNGQRIWTYGGIVQDEQRRAQSIPFTRCTDNTCGNDATVWPETSANTNFMQAHYNTQGMLNVGNYLGKAMVEYLEGNKPPAIPLPSSGFLQTLLYSD